MTKKTVHIGTIKITKFSVGHQGNTHKVHQDSRTKRVRTRSAKVIQWKKEW